MDVLGIADSSHRARPESPRHGQKHDKRVILLRAKAAAREKPQQQIQDSTLWGAEADHEKPWRPFNLIERVAPEAEVGWGQSPLAIFATARGIPRADCGEIKGKGTGWRDRSVPARIELRFRVRLLILPEPRAGGRRRQRAATGRMNGARCRRRDGEKAMADGRDYGSGWGGSGRLGAR